MSNSKKNLKMVYTDSNIYNDFYNSKYIKKTYQYSSIICSRAVF